MIDNPSHTKIHRQLHILLLLFLLIFVNCLDSVAEAARRRRPASTSVNDRRPASSSSAEEGDDAYDPFADYSEFEYESDEEADVNFFRHGRMLNIGFLGGYKMYLGNLGQKVQNSPQFGFFIAYFFDLRFALQFSYTTADSPIAFQSPARTLTGVGTFNSMALSTKYYFNTQNVTRGFAKLNPYLLVGFNNQYKTLNFSGVPGNNKQAALGFDGGLGIEIPFMRKKMFWGVQGTYHYINFKDSLTDFIYDEDNYGTQQGSMFDIMGLVGVNF